ncbi:hypothetical protein K523DRAFT_326209 [Schizophyllum commune Tattone D]|nr:hypothetical protein K523DRAFT_326209 [Schizophyllum commune Tattone D]
MAVDEDAQSDALGSEGEEAVGLDFGPRRRPREYDSASKGYDEFGEDLDPTETFHPNVERPDDSDEPEDALDGDDRKEF